MAATHIHTKRVKRLKFLLPLLGLLLFIGVFIVDWRSETHITDQFEEGDTDFHDPQLLVDNPELNIETAEGDQMQIQAEAVEATDELQNNFAGEAINGDLIIGGSKWDIKAGAGKADTQAQQYDFSDGVNALVDEDYQIETDELTAISNKDLFSTDKPIKISNDELVIKSNAAQVEGKLGERIIRFSGDVRGSILMESDGAQ